MKATLLIDFGSTFTKVAAIDLEKETILGTAKAPTTVKTDIMIGLRSAVNALVERLGSSRIHVERKYACSSAAGGLRMVTVGLVPSLTVEAARRAALGAGAKVLGSYSHELSNRELAMLEQQSPDIVLLVGGTDGGNSDVIIHNARLLAMSNMDIPIIVAGNKAAADTVSHILTSARKNVKIADNVLPELGKINAGPAQSAIREIFLERIVKAKGLAKAEKYVNGKLMPTPLASLNAARLLALGTENEEGIGDLVAAEVGGATTNVYSIGEGNPTKPGVIVKGLREEYAKRTVEGDLGLRYSAISLVEVAGQKKLLEKTGLSNIVDIVRRLSTNVQRISKNGEGALVDMGLARVAVEIAMERHVGRLEEVHTPFGTTCVQFGKDLTKVKHVIGTGGGIIYSPDPRKVLEETLFRKETPMLLKPRKPDFYLDTEYVFYAMGLLSGIVPDKALRMMKNSLRKL